MTLHRGGKMPNPVVALRVSPTVDEWLAGACWEYAVSRSELIRALLDVGAEHPDEVRTALAEAPVRRVQF
jgi:hypothetical protein